MPPPLALFVGITDLIPNIGATLGTIPVVIVGLLEEPWKGVVAGVVLILYQQVENNLITPRIFKETVEIHPFLSVVDRDRLHVALRDRRRAHRRAGDQGDRDSVRRSARGARSCARASAARAWRPNRPVKNARSANPRAHGSDGRTLLGRPRRMSRDESHPGERRRRARLTAEAERRIFPGTEPLPLKER